MGGSMLVRGKANMEQLEAEVHISLEKFEADVAEEFKSHMKQLERSDRFGSLFEITYNLVGRFAEENWGRQRRRT